LIDVILVKNERTVIQNEVAKHACENTAVKAYKERKVKGTASNDESIVSRRM
jgi:hypothetical protein